MDFIKNLFGGEGKSEYSERIPDVLNPEQFGVFPTFRHGLPNQPSCLAYDSVQFLLAIGSHAGNITVIGKPALEKHFTQPNSVPVVQMVFVENKGRLISRCSDNTVYLWNVKEKLPFIEHKLQFQKEVPCLLSLSYLSNWLYVGMEGGNIHLVQADQFQVSAYNIYWDKVTAHEAGHRNRPGDPIGIREHPLDPSKVLLAYSEGLIVLWNVKNKITEKRFKLPKNNISVLMSIDWNSSGKHFAAGYSDGSVGVFNVKNEGKPEKLYHPHTTSGNNSPIIKLQWITPEGVDPVFVFAGGFPDGGGVSVKSLTLHSSKSTSLLNFEESIVDFICLPSSPFVTDYQKMFAVVVLTDTELIIHDLQSQSYPAFGNPYSFDFNYSPVTAVGYYGNCPDDFVAELQSVLTKFPQLAQSTKRWPLSGGKWGQEAPDPWTDLIITGHANGTVRVWCCRSVISQPLLKIEASSYLKYTGDSNQRKSSTGSQSSITPVISMTSPGKSKSSPDSPLKLTTPVDHSSGTDEPDTPTTTSPKASPRGSPKLFKINSDDDIQVSSSPNIGRKKTKLFSGLGGRKTKKLSAKPRVDKLPESNGGTEDTDQPLPSPIRTPTEEVPKENSKLSSSSKSTSVPVFPNISSPKPTTRVYTTQESTPASDAYTVISLTNASLDSHSELCVNYVRMEPQAQTLCFGTYSGHAFCMDFSLNPVDRAPQTLNIDFSKDSIIKPDEDESSRTVSSGKARPNKLTAVSSVRFDFAYDNAKDKTLPGFHVVQHCYGYCNRTSNTGIHITDMRYNMHKKILIIGGDYGLCIVDVHNNTCVKTLAYLESVLYVADPPDYSRQCRKLVEELFSSSDGSPRQPRPLKKTNRDQSDQLMSPLVTMTSDDANSNSTKIISDCEPNIDDVLITNIEIVQMFVNKSGEVSLTIWVATKSGKVCVYIVNTVKQHGGKQYKIDLLPSSIVLDMKSFVVSMMFLSEWGERLVNPYMSSKNGGDSAKSSPAIVAINKRRNISSKAAAESEKPVNYAVITSRDRIKSIGFPSNYGIAEIKPNLSNGLIVNSEFLLCDGLPCIASWSSSGLVLVHTLPGLKPMLQINHYPLLERRSLYSFKLSCDGQGLYLATPTQFQRFSLIKSNQLNYPASLPDIYVNKEDPQPASKGIFQALFKQGSSVDRDDYFSIEVAGKAWKSVAKRDESLESHQHSRRHPTEGGASGGASGGTSGASNAFQEARQKLDQRGQDLSQLEQRTEQLQDDAADFANVARLLAEKQKKKRLF